MSPDGLALDSADLWALTPREYFALRRVYEDSRHVPEAEESAPAQSIEEKKAKLMSVLLASQAIRQNRERAS